jgi:hypothetical protein
MQRERGVKKQMSKSILTKGHEETGCSVTVERSGNALIHYTQHI